MAQVLGPKAIQQLREVVRRTLYEDRTGRPTGATNKFNGVQPIYYGVTDEDIDAGATGTVSIRGGGTPGSEPDHGENVEAFNRFGDISQGQGVLVGHVGGHWEVIETACQLQNEIHHITVAGSPTSGNFDLDYTVNGVTTPLTFNSNWTSTQFEDEMETHGQLASTGGDVSVTSAGDLPTATMAVEFTGNYANRHIALPPADWGNLTGGTGVYVITSRSEYGSPN